VEVAAVHAALVETYNKNTRAFCPPLPSRQGLYSPSLPLRLKAPGLKGLLHPRLGHMGPTWISSFAITTSYQPMVMTMDATQRRDAKTRRKKASRLLHSGKLVLLPKLLSQDRALGLASSTPRAPQRLARPSRRRRIGRFPISIPDPCTPIMPPASYRGALDRFFPTARGASSPFDNTGYDEPIWTATYLRCWGLELGAPPACSLHRP